MEGKLDFDEICDDIKRLMEGMMVMVKDLARSKGLDPDELLEVNKSINSEEIMGNEFENEQQSPLKHPEIAHNLFDEMPIPFSIERNEENVLLDEMLIRFPVKNGDDVLGVHGFAGDSCQSHPISIETPETLQPTCKIAISQGLQSSPYIHKAYEESSFPSNSEDGEKDGFLHFNNIGSFLLADDVGISLPSRIDGSATARHLFDEMSRPFLVEPDEENRRNEDSVPTFGCIPVTLELGYEATEIGLIYGSPNAWFEEVTSSMKVVLSKNVMENDAHKGFDELTKPIPFDVTGVNRAFGECKDVTLLIDVVVMHNYFDPGGCHVPQMGCVFIVFVLFEHLVSIGVIDADLQTYVWKPGPYMIPCILEDKDVLKRKGIWVRLILIHDKGLKGPSAYAHIEFLVCFLVVWELVLLFITSSEFRNGNLYDLIGSYVTFCSSIHTLLDKLLAPPCLYIYARGAVYGAWDFLVDCVWYVLHNSAMTSCVEIELAWHVVSLMDSQKNGILTVLTLIKCAVVMHQENGEPYDILVKQIGLIVNFQAISMLEIKTHFSEVLVKRIHIFFPSSPNHLAFTNLLQMHFIKTCPLCLKFVHLTANQLIMLVHLQELGWEVNKNPNTKFVFRDFIVIPLIDLHTFLFDICKVEAVAVNCEWELHRLSSWSLAIENVLSFVERINTSNEIIPHKEMHKAFNLFCFWTYQQGCRNFFIPDYHAMSFYIREGNAFEGEEVIEDIYNAMLCEMLDRFVSSGKRCMIIYLLLLHAMILSCRLGHATLITQCAVGMANLSSIVVAENFVWDPGLICSDFSILEDKDVLKGRDLSGSKGFEGILHFVLFIKLFSVFYNYDITNFLMMS